jgi:hypothetical protein
VSKPGQCSGLYFLGKNASRGVRCPGFRVSKMEVRLYVLRLYGLGYKAIDPAEYVTFYDPDGGDNPYQGIVRSSVNLDEALRFQSFKEAYEFLLQVSTRLPLRPDGKKNRPITAYTVEIGHVPDEGG